MTADRPLDPDEVTCPTCGAAPGVICRQPSGRKARAIHYTRRRAADRGEITPPRATPRQTSPGRKGNPKGVGPSPEATKRGNERSAQARARRAKEAAAALEAQREKLEREKLEAEAERLALDALRFENDRAVLKRKTLDAAMRSADTLLEGLRDLRRVELDDEGKPKTTPIERTDRDGNLRHVEEPIVRGYVTPADLERVAKVAASTLNSLRLEEGKPTGINRHEDGGTAAALGEVGTAELLEWAARNLPKGNP